MLPLLPTPESQFLDADGHPYAGGTIDTFIPGTTTVKATWKDPDGTALNTAPIVLDSAGRCLIYADGDYRLILKDSAGNLVWDQDSTTVVSAAMQPVVGGSIANAQTLLGIDPTLGTQLAAESAARIAADSAEAAARTAADNAEAAARAAADTTLQNNINAEAAARAAADANLQAQINALVPSTAQMRAGSVTVSITGDFTLTFSPAFPTDVAQIWVGYPPGVGEPTGGSPDNPQTFAHITSFSVSGAVGVLLNNSFTPVSGSMRYWAIGWGVALAILSGAGVA